MVVTVEGSITFFRAIHLLKRFGAITVIPSSKVASTSASQYQYRYLQPIITQYFIDNKSEIWLLFLIAHSKR